MWEKSIFVIFSLCTFQLLGQEVVLNSNNAVRSFIIEGDTTYFGNDDHIYLLSKGKITNKIYPGGYLLDFKIRPSKVISIANNYKSQKGSVRIFDLKKNSYSLVYKLKNQNPIMAFERFSSQKDSLSILISHTDGKLYWYNSKGNILANLGNYGFVRDIKAKNGFAYFCSDKGGFYRTDGNSSEKVFNWTSKLLGFGLGNDKIYAFDDKGKIIEYNTNGKDISTHDIGAAIIMDMIMLNDNQMVLGDWNGMLTIYDFSKKKVIDSWQGHSTMVLKLQKKNEFSFYSSGQDGTIKRWDINSI